MIILLFRYDPDVLAKRENLKKDPEVVKSILNVYLYFISLWIYFSSI